MVVERDEALDLRSALVALIASVLTLLIAGLVRIAAGRGDVLEHDRRIEELDEDLASWIADDDLRLRRELTEQRDRLAADNLFSSGQYIVSVGRAKEAALRRFRNELRRAQRQRSQLLDREWWFHRPWRRAMGRYPPPLLMVPDEAEPVLDAWRLPLRQHRGPEEEPDAIVDPTQRTLADVLGELEENRREYE